MSKPSFKSLGSGDIAAMQDYAAQRGAPSVNRDPVPTEPVTRENITELPAVAAQDETAITPAAPPAEDKPEVVTPTKQAATRRITLDLPDYVYLELQQKRLSPRNRGRVSLKYLVLRALKSSGYTVHEIDLVQEGRGSNKRKS